MIDFMQRNIHEIFGHKRECSKCDTLEDRREPMDREEELAFKFTEKGI